MPRKGIKMNKSVLQRGIILILCSCILFSICPVYAFAAENQKERVVRIGVPDDTYDKINGNGKRSDMWKSSGKVSHFFTGSSTGSGKILEVGSMGDWEYPHKMFQAFMSNQFADCRDTKCGLT